MSQKKLIKTCVFLSIIAMTTGAFATVKFTSQHSPLTGSITNSIANSITSPVTSSITTHHTAIKESNYDVPPKATGDAVRNQVNSMCHKQSARSFITERWCKIHMAK